MSQNKSSLKYSLLSLLVFGFVFSWFFKEENKDQMIEPVTLEKQDPESANLESKKQSRTTELGTPSAKTKANPKEEIKVIMKDPKMSEAWGMKKANVMDAWKITMGSKNIVVAVIDTGIDINHRDLSGNLWTNKGETGLDANGKDRATNGKDDDGNGFIDDVHGWNFVSNNNSLTDNHGHGTHIAGIIGAEGGNGFGISGVAPKVSIMSLKYYDPTVPNTNNLSNTIKGIKYAIAMGANIINYSGGGLEYSAEEYEAINQARKKGILFIAAAGNERSNSDKNRYYPADYPLSNIISVTAANEADNILPSSNYGQQTVDIQAPGSNIFSTLPNNLFGNMTGTSQATAFATGVAVLVMASNPDFKPEQIKKYILKTGDDVPESQRNKTRYAKRLNSYKALATLDQDVSASGIVADNTRDLKHGTFMISEGKNSLNVDSNGLVSVATVDPVNENGAANAEPSTEKIMNFKNDLNQILARSISQAKRGNKEAVP